MTFENLSKIIHAQRLNVPEVSAYEKIETKSHLIKHGDLYIGNDHHEIQTAILNGAYGIVCEVLPQERDDEIAWLQVENTHEALIKLLRFWLLPSDALFFYFPPIHYEILQKILTNKEIIFLDDDLEKNFKKILLAQKENLFISKNQALLEQIYPEFISYHDNPTPLVQLTHHSLFLSDFSYEDIHYEHIQLPALFLPHLNDVLHFLKEYPLDFDLHKLHFIDYFRPLFVSNKLTIKPFGHSEHAYIIQQDDHYFYESLHYLQQTTPWANILLYLPKNAKLKINETLPTHRYEHLEEIKQIKMDKFNFILILANYNELIKILEQNKKEQQPLLF